MEVAFKVTFAVDEEDGADHPDRLFPSGPPRVPAQMWRLF
jgi:hypothetical protein